MAIKLLNGKPVGQDLIAVMEPFPWTITNPCREEKTYNRMADVPRVDDPCTCEDPDCFFIRIPT